MKRLISLIFRSFLRGLIILSPIAVTGYLIFIVFTRIDSLIPWSMPPGLGFVIVICSVTMIGYLGTRSFFGRTLFEFFDHLLEHTPGIKYVYSSIKDIMTSFVGDKKRFNKPVWVCTHADPEIWRIGFLTQDNMDYLGMEGKIAVYLPHAYAISGWVIMTTRDNVRPVTTMSAAEAMKFAVSGGITTQDENQHLHEKAST